MHAIVYTQYGPPDVLRLVEIEKPVPKDNQILVRVRAASVNSLDWHTMRGLPRVGRSLAGLRRPKNTRPGVDLAGQVEAVGKDVTQFRGEPFFVCVQVRHESQGDVPYGRRTFDSLAHGDCVIMAREPEAVR